MFGLIDVPIGQQQKPTPQLIQSYANGVTVSADRTSINLEGQAVEWIGHVLVTFGPTTVTADRLIMHDGGEDPYGEAVGNVKLIDPEGTLTAASLEYHWKTHFGSARTIIVRVSMLTLMAESADVRPGLWTLRNVGGTGCKLKTPLYFIHTRELQVRPGIGLRAVRPDLSILGHEVVRLPTQSTTFGGGGNSIDLPYPTIRTGSGLGVNWTNQLLLDSMTGLFTKYAVFQRSLPFYNGTLIRSAVSGRDPEPVRTEIGDRFTFGFFDSVQVRDPKSERLYFSSRRLDFGLSSTFGADARDTTNSGAKINKPIEALGQASAQVGGFGLFGLFRAQQVQVGGGKRIQRLILEENLLSPSVALGRSFSLFGRLDAAEFTGGNAYGWLRGQAGIVYQPSTALRFGASYTAVRDRGTPDFAYDMPLRFRELGLRADLDFDTTQIRVLLKYDPSQRAVYDREFFFSQVVGCLEPYIVYRERPHKFFLGIKLPISRAFDDLTKAELARRAAIVHVIDGPKK